MWADAPVQDRRAAGAIGVALRGLAEIPAVEVAVVCRGGGSLTDLWAFCDENLCRSIAHLRLPVISAVGHEVDHTLIDDVAAVCCSTPTHAADALVQIDLRAARTNLVSRSRMGERAARTAVATRAARLAAHAQAPQRSLDGERRRLHQKLREIRASATRRTKERLDLAGVHALVVSRKASAFAASDVPLRRELLDAHARALDAHDPQRTLERGYTLVTGRDGEPVSSAATARERGQVHLRFADDTVEATVDPDGSNEPTK